MNYLNSQNAENAFSQALISAIQDPNDWGQVLDIVMQSTGAAAAIITLRDKSTCQIVNDVELENAYHSPLIRGFSQEAILHYLMELRTIDPWAAFQRQHYPHRPVQMSKVCPPESIPDKTFLTWLNQQGMEDTIVFELDRMAGYWTALNIFVDHSAGPVAERVMDFANTHYDLLRNAWRASQNMARHRQANSALLTHASSGGAPVCLVGSNGEVLEMNDAFKTLIASDTIRVSGERRKISFAHAVAVHGLDRWEQHGFLRHDSDAEEVLVLASPVDPDPMFASKRDQLWLLTCSGSGSARVAPSIADGFNLTLLTEKERKLYDGVVNGMTVPEAGKATALKRSAAFQLWASVKDKLGISSAHQLR